MNIANVLELFVFLYGLGALIVKTFPTIPVKYPWLLEVIKILGKITNRQTDDEAIRANNG